MDKKLKELIKKLKLTDDQLIALIETSQQEPSAEAEPPAEETQEVEDSEAPSEPSGEENSSSAEDPSSSLDPDALGKLVNELVIKALQKHGQRMTKPKPTPKKTVPKAKDFQDTFGAI